jgi:hypothetical protein
MVSQSRKGAKREIINKKSLFTATSDVRREALAERIAGKVVWTLSRTLASIISITAIAMTPAVIAIAFIGQQQQQQLFSGRWQSVAS